MGPLRRIINKPSSIIDRGTAGILAACTTLDKTRTFIRHNQAQPVEISCRSVCVPYTARPWYIETGNYLRG